MPKCYSHDLKLVNNLKNVDQVVSKFIEKLYSNQITFKCGACTISIKYLQFAINTLFGVKNAQILLVKTFNLGLNA